MEKTKEKLTSFYKKNRLIIFSLILMLVSLSAMILVGKAEKKAEKETRIPLPSQEAAISPTAIPIRLRFFAEEEPVLKPAATFSLAIIPDSPLLLSVYRLEVLFDPQILSVAKVSGGSFFKNPTILRQQIDNKQGRLDFSAGINIEKENVNNKLPSREPLAIIDFLVNPLLPKDLSSTTISLGEKTMLYLGGEIENLNREEKTIFVNLEAKR
ncbi:hypothetical protein KBI33_03565 [Candidatus Shapirobacteria bacterium]|nr:hypothetical protein [Candidatus Shapirobacteria bacterium]